MNADACSKLALLTIFFSKTQNLKEHGHALVSMTMFFTLKIMFDTELREVVPIS